MRHFVVKNHEVKRLSQKKRQDFLYSKENVLPEYSDTIIDIADIVIEVKDKKPYRILDIHCARHKVNSRGAIDEKYHSEFATHLAKKISHPDIRSDGIVINAREVFDAKALKNKYEWDISTKDINNIIKLIFK